MRRVVTGALCRHWSAVSSPDRRDVTGPLCRHRSAVSTTRRGDRTAPTSPHGASSPHNARVTTRRLRHHTALTSPHNARVTTQRLYAPCRHRSAVSSPERCVVTGAPCRRRAGVTGQRLRHRTTLASPHSGCMHRVVTGPLCRHWSAVSTTRRVTGQRLRHHTALTSPHSGCMRRVVTGALCRHWSAVSTTRRGDRTAPTSPHGAYVTAQRSRHHTAAVCAVSSPERCVVTGAPCRQVSAVSTTRRGDRTAPTSPHGASSPHNARVTTQRLYAPCRHRSAVS